MISISGLTFAYPGHSPLFTDFSLEIQRGQAMTVLGLSGCGKTTLLYLLAGSLHPQSGSIAVDGQAITRPRPESGLILQDFGLLPWATVRQNASLGMTIRKFYGPDGTHAPVTSADTSAVDTWLERLGLTDYAAQYPGKLSGGQRQRVAIARTLALQPDVLLMDEPFSALDALTRADLQSLTRELWTEQGFTSVIVTHAIEEAALLGQTVLVLGVPPHRTVRLFDNPEAMQPGYEQSAPFRQACASLRAMLEDA